MQIANRLHYSSRLQAQIALSPGADGYTFNLAGINANRIDGLFLSPDGRRAVVMITHDDAVAAKAARRAEIEDGRVES